MAPIDSTTSDMRESLSAKLRQQKAAITKSTDYYNGKHGFQFSSSRYREEYREWIEGVCDNWMPLVVDAVAERITLTGFASDAMPPDSVADLELMEIYNLTDGKSVSDLIHQETLKTGYGYLMVWPGPRTDGRSGIIPRFFPQDSTMVTVVYDYDTGEVAAGYKEWRTEQHQTRAAIYLPDRVITMASRLGGGWDSEESPNPFGLVPIVPFLARPNLKKEGKSEIADLMATQDEINKLLRDMLVASEYSAYRQRWGTGMDIEVDEEGKPIQPFDTGVDRLFVSGNENAKFGEFSASDLSNYVGAINRAITSLAARSRTPPHYLNAAQFPSGDSLRAAETGLVSKCRDRISHFDPSWRKAMVLASRIAGLEERAIYPVWQDPESKSPAVLYDGALKLLAAGVPKPIVWQHLGFSPPEVARMEQMSIRESLVTGSANRTFGLGDALNQGDIPTGEE